MKAPIAKIIASAMIVFFGINTVFTPMSLAQVPFLPTAGMMVSMTPKFNPVVIKGMQLDPSNPFNFDFIVDSGDTNVSQAQLKEEGQKLISYFLASLTTPEKDMWVNLSPYEKDRIIPRTFGDTEMGKAILSQDYLLKQIMATALYPERELGRQFWQKVYAQAQAKFGTTDVPVSTFNKVWILPDQALVYENSKTNSVFVVQSSLKVMLEQDYLAMKNNTADMPDSIGTKVIREIVIPALEKEVNTGKNFAPLRQVYQSLILAAWYKKNLHDNVIAQAYVDHNKTKGIDVADKNITQEIYKQYLQAYRKGVYNFIKEDIDPVTQNEVPRKYFSGGLELNMDQALSVVKDNAQVAEQVGRQLSAASSRTHIIRAQMQVVRPVGIAPIQVPIPRTDLNMIARFTAVAAAFSLAVAAVNFSGSHQAAAHAKVAINLNHVSADRAMSVGRVLAAVLFSAAVAGVYTNGVENTKIDAAYFAFGLTIMGVEGVGQVDNAVHQLYDEFLGRNTGEAIAAAREQKKDRLTVDINQIPPMPPITSFDPWSQAAVNYYLEHPGLSPVFQNNRDKRFDRAMASSVKEENNFYQWQSAKHLLKLESTKGKGETEESVEAKARIYADIDRVVKFGIKDGKIELTPGDVERLKALADQPENIAQGIMPLEDAYAQDMTAKVEAVQELLKDSPQDMLKVMIYLGLYHAKIAQLITQRGRSLPDNPLVDKFTASSRRYLSDDTFVQRVLDMAKGIAPAAHIDAPAVAEALDVSHEAGILPVDMVPFLEQAAVEAATLEEVQALIEQVQPLSANAQAYYQEAVQAALGARINGEFVGGARERLQKANAAYKAHPNDAEAKQEAFAAIKNYRIKDDERGKRLHPMLQLERLITTLNLKARDLQRAVPVPLVQAVPVVEPPIVKEENTAQADLTEVKAKLAKAATALKAAQKYYDGVVVAVNAVNEQIKNWPTMFSAPLDVNLVNKLKTLNIKKEEADREVAHQQALYDALTKDIVKDQVTAGRIDADILAGVLAEVAGVLSGPVATEALLPPELMSVDEIQDFRNGAMYQVDALDILLDQVRDNPQSEKNYNLLIFLKIPYSQWPEEVEKQLTALTEKIASNSDNLIRLRQEIEAGGTSAELYQEASDVQEEFNAFRQQFDSADAQKLLLNVRIFMEGLLAGPSVVATGSTPAKDLKNLEDQMAYIRGISQHRVAGVESILEHIQEAPGAARSRYQDNVMYYSMPNIPYDAYINKQTINAQIAEARARITKATTVLSDAMHAVYQGAKTDNEKQAIRQKVREANDAYVTFRAWFEGDFQEGFKETETRLNEVAPPLPRFLTRPVEQQESILPIKKKSATVTNLAEYKRNKNPRRWMVSALSTTLSVVAMILMAALVTSNPDSVKKLSVDLFGSGQAHSETLAVPPGHVEPLKDQSRLPAEAAPIVVKTQTFRAPVPAVVETNPGAVQTVPASVIKQNVVRHVPVAHNRVVAHRAPVAAPTPQSFVFVAPGYITSIPDAINKAGGTNYSVGQINSMLVHHQITGANGEFYKGLGNIYAGTALKVMKGYSVHIKGKITPHGRIVVDHAMKGGIDLEKVNVSSQGGGVRTAFSNPEQLKMLLNASGLVPVIYKIQAMTVPMINMLLGIPSP